MNALYKGPLAHDPEVEQRVAGWLIVAVLLASIGFAGWGAFELGPKWSLGVVGFVGSALLFGVHVILLPRRNGERRLGLQALYKTAGVGWTVAGMAGIGVSAAIIHASPYANDQALKIRDLGWYIPTALEPVVVILRGGLLLAGAYLWQYGKLLAGDKRSIGGPIMFVAVSLGVLGAYIWLQSVHSDTSNFAAFFLLIVLMMMCLLAS